MDSIKAICEDGSRLLKDTIELSFKEQGFEIPEGCENMFTAEFFGRVIGTFEQNAIGVRLRNCCFEGILGGEGLEVAGEMGRDFMGIMEQMEGMEECDDEECDDEECGEDHDHDHDHDHDDDDESYSEPLKPITEFTPQDYKDLVEPLSSESTTFSYSNFDVYYPPLDGTSLFSTACKMNHSCSPNVFVQYRGGYNSPLVLEAISLRDVKVGEELVISYVDCELSWEERKDVLGNYGFECRCVRCLVESGEGGGEKGEVEGGDDLFGSDSSSEEEDNIHVQPPPPPLPTTLVPANAISRTISYALNCLEGHNSSNDLTLFVEALAEKNMRSLFIFGTKINKLLWEEMKEEGGLGGEKLNCFFGGTVSLALGLAHFGRVTESMSYLDTLLILGAPFPSLEPLIKFVEPHASSTRVLRNMVCFEGTEGRDYYVKDWKNGGEIITEKGMGGRIVGAEGRGIREGDIGKEVRKHVKAYSLIANYKIIQCTNLRRRRSLSSDRFARHSGNRERHTNPHEKLR